MEISIDFVSNPTPKVTMNCGVQALRSTEVRTEKEDLGFGEGPLRAGC